MYKRLVKTFLLAATVLFVVSCTYKAYVDHSFRKNYESFNDLIVEDDSKNPYLKVHFKSGDIAVLQSWNREIRNDSIRGVGNLYDFNRNNLERGLLHIAIDDVAIFETNDTDVISARDKSVITDMAILTAFDAALSVICLSVPKACFGSCPTFYFNPDEEVQYANAEGFSNAIAPSLKQGDIDALNHKAYGGPISLFVKNEALETHVIDKVNLQLVPLSEDECAYQYDDKSYFKCKKPISYKSISGGSIYLAEQLAAVDESEYYSTTDSFDLSVKEEIILDFNSQDDLEKALVINYRQTLLTTYLIYEAISLTGNECGKFMAMLETQPEMRAEAQNPFDLLGSLEVYYFDDKSKDWVYVDELYETGPIARNHELLPLPQHLKSQKNLKLKLRMSKGLWRLDYVGLTSIIGEAEVITIQPEHVLDMKTGFDLTDNPLHTVDDNTLVTLPTDEYELQFELPNPDQQYELFLDSHGYYIEWVRKEWTKEKDLKKLYRIMKNDSKTWTELAQDFKSQEADMERLFWSSKIEYLQ